jgi:hypothetical protein
MLKEMKPAVILMIQLFYFQPGCRLYKDTAMLAINSTKTNRYRSGGIRRRANGAVSRPKGFTHPHRR